MHKILFAAALVAAAPLLEAQVRVEESRPLMRAVDTSDSSDQAQNIQMELFFQLQTLQEEVQLLRGMVEEQAHEISRQQQQRMEDYLDLDRLVSMLTDESRSGRASVTGNCQSSDSTSVAGVSMIKVT